MNPTNLPVQSFLNRHEHTPTHTHSHTHTLAELFLETQPNRWDRGPYKACCTLSWSSLYAWLLDSTSLRFFVHFKPETKAARWDFYFCIIQFPFVNSQFNYCHITFLILFFLILIIFCLSPCCSMKCRRLLLCPPLLPTITETLEDLPAHSTSSQSIQSSQSLEDYMTSIQALAWSVEAPGQSITRFQRSHRTRQFTKGQMKLSASPRTLRASRPKTKDYSLSGNIPEELPIKTDCRDKDPIDWLFGQIRTWKAPKTFHEFLTALCWNISQEEQKDLHF